MKKLFFSIIICITLLNIFPSFAIAQNWEKLEKGLAVAIFSLSDKSISPTNIVAIRIDPKHFDFILKNASKEGKALSFSNWAKNDDLIAAINASMYLPDISTSTGYMRNNEHINNPRIVKNFGAFFVASPKNKEAKISKAKIIDREFDENWREDLENYEIAIQNFRLIDAKGNIVWQKNNTQFAISAIAEDINGNIIFLHCQDPISVDGFAKVLLELPLAIKLVMYVEGGSHSGLFLNIKNADKYKNKLWMGRNIANLWTNFASTPLPNILGIKRKKHE